MAKKSKYSAVIGALPTMGIDPSRRDAMTQVQEQIKAPPTDEDILTLDAPLVLQHITKSIGVLVEAKKRTTAGRPWAAEYARAYAECRAIRDQIAEWDAAFSLLVEAYQWLMCDQLQVEGTTSLKLANGASISTFQEPYAKVDDPQAFLAWVEADPDLRNKLALPWGTTNALVKARLLEGEPEPPGVSCWAKTTIRLGKGEG